MGQFVAGMIVALLPQLAWWHWKRERQVQQEITYPPKKVVVHKPMQVVHPEGSPVLNRYSLRNRPAHVPVRGKRTTF